MRYSSCIPSSSVKGAMNRVEQTYLAVSIALSTATQLRMTSVLGVGEIMVALWMLFTSIQLALKARPVVNTSATKTFLGFWIVAFICLSCGSLIATLQDLVTPTFYRDALALLFVAFFSLLFVMSIPTKRTLENILAILILFATVVQVILLLLPISLPLINPWYQETRFQGWSNNPNQMGLLASTLPFFGLYFLRRSDRWFTKLWYSFVIVGSFFVGVATQSDSFRLGIVAGIGVLLFSAVYYPIADFVETHSSRFSVFDRISLKQIPVLILLLIVLLIGYLSYDKLHEIFIKIYSYSSQGDDRLFLWRNGVAAILRSPIFGLGPGTHSGATEPLFFVEDSHNAFIEWAASTGIVGLAACLFLLGWIGWKAWRNRFPILLAALCSLIVYVIFAYLMRHIVFWFYLITIASLSLIASRSDSLDSGI